MNPSRPLSLTAAAIACLMTAAAGAMAFRAASPLQVRTAALLAATSLIALALLARGRLLRWLRSPALPPGLRLVGGALCLATAAITSWTVRPPFLSFSFLNALWIVLVGCLLVASVLADWFARGESSPAGS